MTSHTAPTVWRSTVGIVSYKVCTARGEALSGSVCALHPSSSHLFYARHCAESCVQAYLANKNYVTIDVGLEMADLMS